MGLLLHDVIECYPKPAFVTYCVHSAYAICLLPWCCWEWWNGRTLKRFPLMTKRIFWSAAALSLVAYAAAYFWYLSLPLTFVWANNAIYQSNCIWVYLASMCFLGAKWRWRKVIPLILCFAGILVISLLSDTAANGGSSPTPSPTPSPSGKTCQVKHVSKPEGYFFCLISVLGFALYEVLYKKYGCHHEEPGQEKHETPMMDSISGSMFYLGLIGMFTAVLVAPLLAVLDATQYEKWEMPSSYWAWQIVINCGLDSLFNLALLIGIAFIGPLVMSIGMMLIIPVGIFVDAARPPFIPIGVWPAVGSGMIILGFIHLNFASKLEACCAASQEEKVREHRRSTSSPVPSTFDEMGSTGIVAATHAELRTRSFDRFAP